MDAKLKEEREFEKQENKMLVEVKDGKVDVKKVYYKSGALLSETPYINGEIHGVVKGYHESGVLEMDIPYTNGKIHGVVKRYDKSGTLKWEIPFVKGRMHGVEKRYDESGKLLETVEYKNNSIYNPYLS